MNEFQFGEWSIERSLYDWLVGHLPEGKTILELGSGAASDELSKVWKLYSVEHDPNFLWKSKTNYIFAPITNGWYDIYILKQALPAQYDFVLVDGPEGFNRPNMNKYADILAPGVPYLFDDVQEYAILNSAKQFAEEYLKRPYEIIKGESKSFMVIPC